MAIGDTVFDPEIADVDHSRYRLIVFGSRLWDDVDTLWATLDGIHATQPGLIVMHAARYPAPVLVDAPEADGAVRRQRPRRSAAWLAHLWCLTHYVIDDPHHVDWETCQPDCDPGHRVAVPGLNGSFCPDAERRRYADMIAAGADGCAVFIRGDVPDDASEGADLAEAAGIPVTRPPYHGTSSPLVLRPDARRLAQPQPG